jgi:hypothetical protein
MKRSRAPEGSQAEAGSTRLGKAKWVRQGDALNCKFGKNKLEEGLA